MTKQFTYNVANVDKKVKTVDVIESKDGLKFTMIMKIPANLFNKMNSVELKGMSLTFPSHLEMADGSPAHVTIDGNASNAKYDPATGVILIPSHMAKTPEVKLEVTAQVINVNEMDGMKLTDGKFTFDGQIVVNKGQVVFNPAYSHSSATMNSHHSISTTLQVRSTMISRALTSILSLWPTSPTSSPASRLKSKSPILRCILTSTTPALPISSVAGYVLRLLPTVRRARSNILCRSLLS